MRMKKDTLHKLFDQPEGSFDLEAPEKGHQDRFLQKLNESKGVKNLMPPKRKSGWKLFSIAASCLLIISLGIGIANNYKNTEEVISPEIQETQFYFASLLEEEIEKLNDTATEDTKSIINDVMIQLDRLESDYKKLELILLENGNNKQILYAMITNFQTRINLLKDVIQQIEEVKQQKNTTNENNII